MPHELHAYRNAIDALIGPIEEIAAKAASTLPRQGNEAYVCVYVLGGLEQALETLSETVKAIDEFEEEDETDSNDEIPDHDDDEDEDEEATEDELAEGERRLKER
jgi:hypothetical protein